MVRNGFKAPFRASKKIARWKSSLCVGKRLPEMVDAP